MSEQEELLKAFREWTEDDEDFWIERFGEISNILMGARVDPDSVDSGKRLDYEERLAGLKEDTLMAAELADAAVEEMQSRFEIQNQQQAQRRRKSKAQYEDRRKKRLESRR